MIAINRFQVAEAESAQFLVDGEQVAAFFRGRDGCQGAELVRSLDDPTLWALVSTWIDVGSYRRAFTGFDAKMLLTPFLSRALDEPSAFAPVDDVGTNHPRQASWFSALAPGR